MKRELTVDARQVHLGENLTLGLELITEDKKKKLLDELVGDKWHLYLAFDNLTSDTPKEPFLFEFTIDRTAGNEMLNFDADDLKQSGAGLLTTGKERTGLFRRIILLDQKISLFNKDSITVNFVIEVWDNPGIYTIDGGITTSDVDGAYYDPEKDPKLLDFGPVRLKVVEELNDRPVKVSLNEANRLDTSDQLLWVLIRNRTVEFRRYRDFIDRVMCSADVDELAQKTRTYAQSRNLPFARSASYSMLKYATEFYLMQETGLVPAGARDTLLGEGLNLNRDGMALDGLDRGRIKLKNEFSRTQRTSLNLRELRDDYLDKLQDEDGRVLPYFNLIRQKLEEVPLKNPNEIDTGGVDLCYGILKSKLQNPPLIELIWSYYQEEGGLVQTLNAIGLRFQNVRRPGPGPDPLANLNLDPLRPLSNLIWGYIEDERNRLTINRRNLEYQYEYGISLIGRAVQGISVAEHRTQFLRAFHDLLRMCIEFYEKASFTTIIPDGFPILNHLREVHLALAEGAHNQYGDLPWTARVEMLTQQWILARPEVREFLGGRIMVPYSEPWMDRVDNMKQLQGWNTTNITHFRDLAVFGEQLLLSIRYGSWHDPNIGGLNAANWAHYWREDIQRYIHAYKAVTGVDLANEVTDTRIHLPGHEDRYMQPAALIERQVALQQFQQNGGNRVSLPHNRSAARGQLAQPPQVVRRETYNNE
jgi:hypothetical protein